MAYNKIIRDEETWSLGPKEHREHKTYVFLKEKFQRRFLYQWRTKIREWRTRKDNELEIDYSKNKTYWTRPGVENYSTRVASPEPNSTHDYRREYSREKATYWESSFEIRRYNIKRRNITEWRTRLENRSVSRKNRKIRYVTGYSFNDQ